MKNNTLVGSSRSGAFGFERIVVRFREITTAKRLKVQKVNAFSHKLIGGFAVRTFDLQIAWYVCTCLPRGNQVDGLPRAASGVVFFMYERRFRTCYLTISRDHV